MIQDIYIWEKIILNVIKADCKSNLMVLMLISRVSRFFRFIIFNSTCLWSDLHLGFKCTCSKCIKDIQSSCLCLTRALNGARLFDLFDTLNPNCISLGLKTLSLDKVYGLDGFELAVLFITCKNLKEICIINHKDRAGHNLIRDLIINMTSLIKPDTLSLERFTFACCVHGLPLEPFKLLHQTFIESCQCNDQFKFEPTVCQGCIDNLVSVFDYYTCHNGCPILPVCSDCQYDYLSFCECDNPECFLVCCNDCLLDEGCNCCGSFFSPECPDSTIFICDTCSKTVCSYCADHEDWILDGI